MKSKYSFILIPVIFVFCMATIMTSMVDARGRGGGGGGFSRGGPAAGGGFSSRPAARQPDFQRDRDPVDRQERRDDARDDRQDYLDDEWDDHHHGYYGGVAVVGSTDYSDYVTSAPCSTTEIVNGSTYYHCGSTWYRRGHEGGEVVYIIVSPPAGR